MEKMRIYDRINFKFAIFYSLFFLFFLLGLTSLQAKELETLFHKFDQAETKDKPEIALEIGEKYNADFAEEQEQYLQLGKQAAQQLDDKQAEIQILFSLSSLFQSMGEIEKSMDYIETAAHFVEESSENQLQITWHRRKAGLLRHQGKMTDAIELLEEAQQIAKDANDTTELAAIYTDLGSCFFQISYYDKAFSNYQKAYGMYEKVNNIELMGASLVNLANVYNRTGQFEEALENYQKAAEFLEQSGNTLFYANAMNNIASTYVRLEQFQLALETHLKALSLYEKEENTIRMAYSLYNIGILQRNLKNYETSTFHYLKALELFKQNDYRKGIAFSTIGLAENFVLQEKYEQAYDYILEAEKLTEGLGMPQHSLSVYNLFMHYYDGIKDYQKAFEALHNATQVDKIITSKKQDSKLIEMKTKFQFDQKIKQIELLEKDKSINRLRFLALLFALIGFAGIAFLYRYRFIEKNKANKVIQKHEKELELVNSEQKKLLNELEELNITKNKLFSILAHDLKNGFTALMKGTKLLSEKIHILNAESIPIIAEELHKSSVTMYEMLENLIIWGQLQKNQINLQQRALVLNKKVESIIKLLMPLADEKNIIVQQSIPAQVQVFADSATLLSVLQNLIHNALKFTNDGGKVIIEAEETAEKVRIFIKDSGRGMKEEEQAALFNLSEMRRSRGTKGEKGTGLGLLICKEFAEMNQGSLSFESEYGKGTTFIISLPKPVKK